MGHPYRPAFSLKISPSRTTSVGMPVWWKVYVMCVFMGWPKGGVEACAKNAGTWTLIFSTGWVPGTFVRVAALQAGGLQWVTHSRKTRARAWENFLVMVLV